jgi:hypothetical protein
MTSKLAVSVFAFFAALTVAVGSDARAQQTWQQEWADTVAKAKGQPLVLSVHSIEGHEQVVREFQNRQHEQYRSADGRI